MSWIGDPSNTSVCSQSRKDQWDERKNHGFILCMSVDGVCLSWASSSTTPTRQTKPTHQPDYVALYARSSLCTLPLILKVNFNGSFARSLLNECPHEMGDEQTASTTTKQPDIASISEQGTYMYICNILFMMGIKKRIPTGKHLQHTLLCSCCWRPFMQSSPINIIIHKCVNFPMPWRECGLVHLLAKQSVSIHCH